MTNKTNKPLLFDSETVENLAAAFDVVSPEANEPLVYLKECIRELNSRARKICELQYEDDLKPAAITQRLGVSANSVSKGLQRIREMLLDKLPRAKGGPETVLLELIDQSAMAEDFFQHASHHDSKREVIHERE